jgi:hypothetical protein
MTQLKRFFPSLLSRPYGTVAQTDTMRRVNISGSQVILAMATGLCLIGPLVWAFVRYWLFAL